MSLYLENVIETAKEKILMNLNIAGCRRKY